MISLKARIVTTFAERGHGTHARVPGVAGIILLPELGGSNKSYNKFIKLHKCVVWFSASIFYFILKWLIDIHKNLKSPTPNRDIIICHIKYYVIIIRDTD